MFRGGRCLRQRRGAALFMTVAKMVLKTAAQAHNITVDKLLSTANNLLCQENPAELFVTAYVGIMDINSGEIAYACAGHIRRSSSTGRKQ